MGGFFSPSTTASSAVEIPEELRPYAGAVGQFLTGRLGETGPSYPGALSAPITPQEQYGLGATEDFASNAYYSGIQPEALGEVGRTLSGYYLPGANPYLADIEQDIMGRYRELLGSGQTSIAQAGQGAGTPYARMVNDVGTGLAGEIGRLRYGAYEAERARQQGAVGAGLEYPVSMAQALMQAGALPRTLSQQDLDRGYQEFLRLWNESYRAAGQGINVPSGVASTQYGPSPFMSLASGALPFFLPR